MQGRSRYLPVKTKAAASTPLPTLSEQGVSGCQWVGGLLLTPFPEAQELPDLSLLPNVQGTCFPSCQKAT